MLDRDLMIKAEQGDKASQYELGMYYFNENCLNFAFYWIMRSAKGGDSRAMFVLGEFYRKGIGVKIDLKKSYKWLKKASKEQNTKAMNALITDYMEGVFPSSSHKTLKLCKKSSKSDSKLGEYYLGLCYYKGIGVKRDIEKARYHFTMSAVHGFEFAKSQLCNKDFGIVI